MNILYDFQIFAMQRYGGVSRYFYELISKFLDSQETDVSLFMGSYINEYGIEKRENDFKNFKGHRFHGNQRLKRFVFFKNEFKFRSFLKGINTDIYHPTYYRNFDFVKRKKMVMTVHDLTHEMYPGSFKYPKLLPNLRKKQLEKADGIICVSESTKKDLIKYYPVKEDIISVIHHANSLQPPLNTAPLFDKPYLLFVGGRAGYKNFSLLYNVFKNNRTLNKDYLLVCYGGNNFSWEELEKFSMDDMNEKIKWIAGDDSVLANLYLNAAAFIYPSLNEGFGIPILEAMSLECPVLAANKSSLPEVGSDAAMYFDPESENELEEKLNLLLSDNEIRSQMIKKGVERNSNFTWEKCARETLDFYNKILSR